MPLMSPRRHTLARENPFGEKTPVYNSSTLHITGSFAMKLLGSVTSPFVRKVRIVLIEKHIDFELVTDAMVGDIPL